MRTENNYFKCYTIDPQAIAQVCSKTFRKKFELCIYNINVMAATKRCRQATKRTSERNLKRKRRGVADNENEEKDIKHSYIYV